ncbi:MAG: hypothetical protein ACOCX2_14950 [Armatimonadota bacterium]
MRRVLLVLAVCMMPVALAADGPTQPTADEDAIDEVPSEDGEVTEIDAEDEATSSASDLLTLLANSTADQRARMLRFIRNRYPGLTADLLGMLQSREPGIFVALDAELEALVASRYPRLRVEVQRILQQAINDRYPQVRREIAELIVSDYPDVAAAMSDPALGDSATNAARAIRERHRALLRDVLDLLRREHPGLLREVQIEVVVQHPELLLDAAALISEQYPRLASEMTEALGERYPELIPGVLEIIAPIEDAEDEDTEQ